ncbi:putative Ubiquitin and WLM domain-containing protein [Glarea lozoyensis 74030]|uniref:Putative Ubiquitin and WLM domain-containing protein n=1 Tax=Glarea lozoyensis (strain ATCC 74030 / MF5533) TaxID=1104152 RepID=H0EQU3_GLAL7|nr:putative Ubiquitin and WLM domain-containing protein [Glarea lozoyensis 74030]
MRDHQFTVGLLTEMNPVEHTQSNHEGTSRTLGLNRNQGEVIELRLRTDANTLCHELAHNVHGPHDRKFWDLCKQIEKEVDLATSSGRTIGEREEYYDGGHGEDVDDHGGWTGGEFVVGGSVAGGGGGLSRREVLAKAAEERMKRLREQQGGEGSGTGS